MIPLEPFCNQRLLVGKESDLSLQWVGFAIAFARAGALAGACGESLSLSLQWVGFALAFAP